LQPKISIIICLCLLFAKNIFLWQYKKYDLNGLLNHTYLFPKAFFKNNKFVNKNNKNMVEMDYTYYTY